MKPLLAVLNPRDIRECVESYLALTTIDLVWIRRYTERGVSAIFPRLVADARARDYTHMLVVSDDGIVFDKAVRAVLALLDANEEIAATGYCNMDNGPYEGMVNLTRFPLTSGQPSVIDTPSRAEVQHGPEDPIRTYFSGLALTGMSLDLWERFPLVPFHGELDPGFGSDYHLSWRLQQAGVPIWAARDAFVYHVKETWNELDKEPRKMLRNGLEPAQVVWDPRDRAELLAAPRGGATC